MNGYYFRVEHDLLRSEAFRTLGGSAIKVYLVIGLYSDFGTDWAYPSIRTIARQAGLSRQTVLTAIEDLTKLGLLATSKSKGRSTAYRIIRQAPQQSHRLHHRGRVPKQRTPAVPNSLEESAPTGQDFLWDDQRARPKTVLEAAQLRPSSGQAGRPKPTPDYKHTIPTAPIPGTPFQLTADGRLHVTVDLQELLASQGIPEHLAHKLLAQRDPEAVAKVLLNAFYLQSQGKLQNGPGYIRAGIEDGYDLLPQVATRLENRRRELEAHLRKSEAQEREADEIRAQHAEQSAMSYVLERLAPTDLKRLIERALALLPEPIVRRNPTLSNPFIRAKVYELACGEPAE
jgi:Helix-turn-helix domain